MGKTSKVVICGMKGVGKTALLEQVIYGSISPDSKLHSTIEDIYIANIESDKGTKEKVRFYDTAGIELQTTTAHGTTNQQLPRHYLAIADGYVLVYDTDRSESLDVLVALKRDIDKNKDKKEVTIIAIGNKFKETENPEFESTLSKATAWCNREKVRHFTASAMQRSSLYEAFVYITSKLNPPPSKSTFTPLSMGRKAKDL